MWNNESFNDGAKGAGFMNTQSQFTSPAPGRKEREAQLISPITIKMIQDCQGDSITIGNSKIHMVVIVGIIQAVDISSTKTTYTIDDSTGTIDCVQWLESNSEMESDAQTPLMEMTYCKLVGTLRTQMGMKQILILNIVPLTDVNKLTAHLLEVIHTPLKLQQLEQMRGNPPATLNPGQSSAGAPGQVLPEGNMQGLSGPSRLVYQLIKVSTEEWGIHRDELCKTLSSKLQPPKIDQILEELSSEGLVFCSIDEDHYKASDS